MATKSDELKAQLKVVELEEKLVEAKDTEKGPSKQLKDQVRQARYEARVAREGGNR